MVADKGFHVDGWEEVWEYEDPQKPGLWKIYDPSVWNVDLNKTKLTGYHWNNMWEEDDGPTTGYMMANAGYNVRIISGVIKILNVKSHKRTRGSASCLPKSQDFFIFIQFKSNLYLNYIFII